MASFFAGPFRVKQITSDTWLAYGRVVRNNTAEFGLIAFKQTNTLWQYKYIESEAPARTFLATPFQRRQS
jgi:hypothetical protein